MKLDRLFRIGSQAFRAYRSYRGKGSHSGYSSRKFGGTGHGNASQRQGTLERLVRRFLK